MSNMHAVVETDEAKSSLEDLKQEIHSSVCIYWSGKLNFCYLFLFFGYISSGLAAVFTFSYYIDTWRENEHIQFIQM